MSTLTPPREFTGVFCDDLTSRAVYAETAGIQQQLPLAVAVPATATDVEVVVKWARREGVSLIPRGSGSSMPGGALGTGIILDVSRLRDMRGVDLERKRISVGPGVRRDEVETAAHAVGLHFPVDPSSGEFCTVGGMAATNAAGAHSLKYGSMRPWVAGLDCVFSDGNRAWVRRGAAVPSDIPAIRRFVTEVAPAIRAVDPASLRHGGVRKDSSGYAAAVYATSADLVDLLVGSEGTLAVFVGVELALVASPTTTTSVLAAFPSLEAAVAGAAAARESGASACEMLDRTFLDLVREAADPSASIVPAETEVVLLIELEGERMSALADATHTLGRVLRESGAMHVAVALDDAAQSALWHLRHAASPALARLDPALKSMQFIEDSAVPPDRLPDYVRGVRAALDRRGVRGAIFGHAGDANVHVNPLIDVRRADWRDVVNGLLADVTALTLALRGTLTGEHGDGRLRAPFVEAMWGGQASPAMKIFSAVKTAFDPDGVFNPGVKLPVLGDLPIGAIKYDPALPPLPAAARRALDRVADERAYGVLRLDLLDN